MADKYLNYDGLSKLAEILKNKFTEISNGINVKVNWGGVISPPDFIERSEFEAKFNQVSTGSKLEFFCKYPVQVSINDVVKNFPSNSFVSETIGLEDTFEIIPSQNDAISMLTAYPGAINYFYDWLEGVDIFSGILFDMNNEDMYTKWNQNNQGQYQVQMAQYNNCIFWSDNPYINDLAVRTNYTLYATTQLPLCYSTIPENTYKPFYCAYAVTNDPNWANPDYRNSFSNVTYATQTFSYYAMQTIGVYNMDSSLYNIKLPKDCRGLMFYSPSIENAGVFDAANTTNFGAKSGSWREAFGNCSALRNLYIKNLKTSINISWSPINQESLNFILSKAINTSAITIYLSPHTYYSLSDENKELALSKNIGLVLIDTNVAEDNRLANLVTGGDGTKYLTDNGTYAAIQKITESDILRLFS